MTTVKINSRDFQQMLLDAQKYVSPDSPSGKELLKVKRRGQLIEIEDLNITVKVSSKLGHSIMVEACPGYPYGLDLIVSDSPKVKYYLKSSYNSREEAIQVLKDRFVAGL